MANEIDKPKPATTALTVAPPLQILDPQADPTTKALIPARDPYEGIASKPFKAHAGEVLMAATDTGDVEIRPDGIVYLPEIKYRRRLNQAFGPGGWALMPRGEHTMMDNTMTREYALYVDGRYISEARGEQDYIPSNPNMSYATATEGVKSNALMRCCKDIGIASELWDPVFIAAWKSAHAVQVWRGSGKPNWRRKDRERFYDEKGPVEQKSGDAPPAVPPASTAPKPQPANGGGAAKQAQGDGGIWRGKIADVAAKKGTNKKGNPYTLYRVSGVDGSTFGTFDDNHGATASDLKRTGEEARIVWKRNDYGMELVNIEPAAMTPDNEGGNG